METFDVDVKSTQKSLLLLSERELFAGRNEYSINLLSNDYALEDLNSPSTTQIFAKFPQFYENQDVEISLKKAICFWLESNTSTLCQFQVLSIGITALLKFVQHNWSGPDADERLSWLRSYLGAELDEDFNNIISSKLILDGESVISVTKHLEYLVLARAALLTELPDLDTSLWWRFRCLFLHQQVLEEKSPILHDEMHSLEEKLLHCEDLKKDKVLNTLLHLELAHMHLFYHEVQPSGQILKTAVESAGLNISLTGALGKRTRFQQRNLAQLVLDVQSSEATTIVSTLPLKELPKDLKLDDETRLDAIAFSNSDDGKYSTLTPLQQACTQKCQPKDKLADEELLAYLSCLLGQPQVWSFQMSCLMFRSKIESNHSRTVERSMTQAQALVDAVNASTPGAWQRLFMIFCSYMPPRWCLEEELANLLVSLGCINSALDIYLRLHCWEEVIACYNHLKLRHKAEEIIRQELDKKETVKLWCLLGDATDNVEYYEKAWNLSNMRSARAQRHWGLYFFHRKQYGEAIPHLQESLSHNSLQTTLWFQLGYASLQHEDWTSAATAYRRCCFLDPENFEAWNNLAKAYVKLGQKNRAWKALQEALKWDFENWRVWENYLLVSLDCAVMDEVIRAYHRILDLKEKHVDVEVLEILGRAIIDNLPDCDGEPCGRLLDKSLALLGRVTAQVTNNWKVWRVYSRLTSALQNPTPESEVRAVQHLQKAHRCAIADASWVNDNDLCLQVIDLSEELANVTTACASKCSNNKQVLSLLSSAKLSLKSTLTKIKQQRLDLLTGQVDQALLPQFTSLEAHLERISCFNTQ
ncbi:Tetratricopeptide repeat protein 27 [Frankliniella fusca]|uniref:Tetratricopeptide repeat protein 27 n=1 Tax=Frankliniella fusca TaxID=407009 RepID=A0AAE1LCE0_9NEOP|nr:Tetratricopeptide repeat protein 27 [Frankliniella fusca]